MLYRKQGFPEEGELVICTVGKVHFHTVFIKLDEYDKQGVIHISEISPGRIRNIRDYVKEGKKIICKILRVNKERGHIDLSLRRVTDMQRKAKNNEIKQEQLAEKIVEQVAKKLKKNLHVFYDEITSKVFEKYPTLFECFNDFALGNADLREFKINAKDIEELEILIKQRIKPKEIQVKGHFEIKFYQDNGLDLVKKTFSEIEMENLEVSYLGGGKYKLVITSPDYKTGEKVLDKSLKKVNYFVEENEGEVEFVRENN